MILVRGSPATIGVGNYSVIETFSNTSELGKGIEDACISVEAIVNGDCVGNPIFGTINSINETCRMILNGNQLYEIANIIDANAE